MENATRIDWAAVVLFGYPPATDSSWERVAHLVFNQLAERKPLIQPRLSKQAVMAAFAVRAASRQLAWQETLGIVDDIVAASDEDEITLRNLSVINSEELAKELGPVDELAMHRFRRRAQAHPVYIPDIPVEEYVQPAPIIQMRSGL